MKILIIGETNVAPYTKAHFQQIKDVSSKLEVVATDDTKKVAKELSSADVIITSPFHQSLIDLKKAKNLKWVHLSSAGVTDMAKYLAPTDIILTNSSGVHPIPISEHVATFMLMFARQINKIHKTQVVDKTWERHADLLNIFEVNNSTVGIVGFGRIGAAVGRISKGLGAKVVAFEHDKKINDKNIDKTYKKLDELLEVSDFVVNCLPLTSSTQGFFDSKKFKAMKKSAYFINIGRGKTVVEKDLIKALSDGVIAGAGLDVFETEPLPETSPLWDMDNVIITPHVSGWTPFYTDRVIEIFCTNLKNYLKGTKMPTLVDKTRGY